jgi:hypothetical protein
MGIGEYFFSVASASVITALAGMLFADEKTSFGKLLNTVCSLFLLCVIVSPLSGVIAHAREDIDWDASLTLPEENAELQESAILSALAKESGESIEAFLCEYLAERAELDVNNIKVSASVNAQEGGVSLDRVVIRLYSAAMWCDPRVLEHAVSELTDAECIIVNGD